MEDPIPRNNKFCCIALENVGCEPRDDHIQLQGGLSVHTVPPFKLDQNWEKWLGTIRSKHLSDSNFVIIAHAPSETPRVADEEHKDLEQVAMGYLYALLLENIPYNDGGLIIGGSSPDGHVEARTVGDLPNLYRTSGVWPNHISNASIGSADKTASGIRFVFGQREKFGRLKRGFHAWTSAVQEPNFDSRLHQFVRSVEALIKPARGSTQREFSNRCLTFIRPSPQARDLLWELYDLRSATEHMHGWESALPKTPKEDQEKYASLKGYQAELLAGKVYATVLQNQELLSCFETDESIRDFWKLQDHKRKALWGSDFDLEKEATSRFRYPT